MTLCKTFIENTYGCKLAKGSPCSGTFPLENYATHRMQAAELAHDELDLVILGSLMSIINTDSNIKDGAHKPVKRKRTFLSFQHNGHQVCQITYRFLFGIGKQIEGSKSLLLIAWDDYSCSWEYWQASTQCHILCLNKNFAEQQAILLPGRIPRYKRDDFKLLPSSIIKKVNHYITVLQTILVTSICIQYN